VLGHERCAVVAGDVGGVVAVDLAQRFEGFVERLCFFNTVPPAAPGFDLSTFSALAGGPTGDYQELQGARPEELAAMLKADPATARCIAERVMIYGLGRGLESGDAETLDRITTQWAGFDHRFRALLSLIAQSEPFRYRRGEPAGGTP